MGVPLALLAAGTGASIAGNVMSAREQERARKAEIERQQKIARREAIERALGLGLSLPRREKIITPNLVGPAMITGLGQLGTTMGTYGLGRRLGTPKLPHRNVPEIPIG